jgi:ABC-type sulfate transport system permease component
MRQWFKTLPAGLEEAAKIDGCNPLQTFYGIALPLPCLPWQRSVYSPLFSRGTALCGPYCYQF